MGRVKRQVPKGKYRLRTSTPIQPDKRYPIYLEYTWNESVIRRAADVKCKVSDWNAKGNLGRGELRPSYGNEYKRLNALLLKLENPERTDPSSQCFTDP